MTPFALLSTLRELGILLTPMPDGEHLHIDAPAGVLTDALRQAIRSHKQDILDMAEWFEERSAILEYDAGLSRADAESEAWRLLEARYGQPQ